MTKPHLTNFGTPGVGVVPYGIHMCHFYASHQELIDGLVPYFVSGLAANERCIWVASAPLPAHDVLIEAAKHPELQRGIASGQLRVLEAAEWYGDPATFDHVAGLQRVLDEERRALADGFLGLRISGNASFVRPEQWDRFMEYERKIQDQLRNHRIVACCSYPRKDSRPVEVIEVVHRHDGALDQTDGQWQMFLTPKAGVMSST